MTVLSIVIPSWNTRDLLRTCLRTVEAARKPGETEIVIVDNASHDGSADMVAEEFPEVVLQRNAANEGFAIGCNQGIALARGEYVLLLNADTEVGEDALVRMVDFLREHPDYGGVAPRLLNPDGSTQRSCQAFPKLATVFWFATPFERWFPDSKEMRRYFLRDWDHEDERDIDQPPAACLMITRRVIEEVGVFDESLWLFYNDVDLSLRMHQHGLRTRFLPQATVLHHVGASTSQFGSFLTMWQKNRLTYYRKHHGRLAGVWLKACVSLAFVDWCCIQLKAKLRRRGGEPLWTTTQAWLRYLAL